MTFDEWLNEIENYSLRIERLYDDLDAITGVDKTASESVRNRALMLGWLKAAYETGYSHGYNEGV
jgi:hypothetical protein